MNYYSDNGKKSYDTIKDRQARTDGEAMRKRKSDLDKHIVKLRTIKAKKIKCPKCQRKYLKFNRDTSVYECRAGPADRVAGCGYINDPNYGK